MIITVKATIDSRDAGIKILLKEYNVYLNELIPQVQKAVRAVVKDREIVMMAQQKWMVDQSLTQHLDKLPFHPMTFHRASIWVEDINNLFSIHIKTKDGEAVCGLKVPSKYYDLMVLASGKCNDALGQAEIIEDNQGRIRVHLVIRQETPKPYETDSWIGVDVGWNVLAVSCLVTPTSLSQVDLHMKEYKTQIIQLKHLLKEYQRSGRSWGKWNNRLQNVIRNATGTIAKQIVAKAKKNHAGVVVEDLNFRSSTKQWLIPRFKLQMAIENLCSREGIPFKKVNAKYTSQICNRCGYKTKENRKNKAFHCLSCGYTVHADVNAAMNIGRAAISSGYTSEDKEVRLHAEAKGEVSTPIDTLVSPMEDV
jgi:IS605 OrfB family transposase